MQTKVDFPGGWMHLSGSCQGPRDIISPCKIYPAPSRDRAACATTAQSHHSSVNSRPVWWAGWGKAVRNLHGGCCTVPLLQRNIYFIPEHHGKFLCLALSLAPYTESQDYRMALLEETLGIIWFPHPHSHRQEHLPSDQVAESLDQKRLRCDLNILFSWQEVVAKWRSASSFKQSVTGWENIVSICTKRDLGWILGGISSQETWFDIVWTAQKKWWNHWNDPL